MAKQNKPTMQEISLLQISTSKTNPRKSFNDETLIELADSMAANGLLQPITVRPDADGFEIVAGERRYRAAMLLKWQEIPAIIRKVSDEQMLEIQILENLQREDVSPLDEATAFASLLKKESIDWLATKINKSKKYVLDRIHLNDLCLDAKLFLTKNILPLGHANLLSKLKEKDQEKLMTSLVYKKYNSDGNVEDEYYCGKTYSQLKNEIDSLFIDFSRCPFDTAKDNLVDGVVSCNYCPKRTCNQNLFFGDITSEDKCTDAVCFKSKVDAHIAASLKAAKEQHEKVYSGEVDAYSSNSIKTNGQSLSFYDKPKKGLTPIVITKADRVRGNKLGTTVWVEMPTNDEVKEKKGPKPPTWAEQQEAKFNNEIKTRIEKALPFVYVAAAGIDRSAIVRPLCHYLLNEVDLKILLVCAVVCKIAIPTEPENIYDYVENLQWGDKEKLQKQIIKSIDDKCNDSMMLNIYFISLAIDNYDKAAKDLDDYDYNWQQYLEMVGIEVPKKKATKK